QGTTNAQAGAKKSFDYNPKKREGEANAVLIGSSQPPFTPMPHCQYPYTAATAQGQYPQQLHHAPPPQQPFAVPRQNHQQQGGYQQRNQLGPGIDRKRRN
ncbi:hypothetical protein A2U01_0071922, partial [Trifolium medium]|nr:hypothetical protein [Trifolium medium]